MIFFNREYLVEARRQRIPNRTITGKYAMPGGILGYNILKLSHVIATTVTHMTHKPDQFNLGHP